MRSLFLQTISLLSDIEVHLSPKSVHVSCYVAGFQLTVLVPLTFLSPRRGLDVLSIPLMKL